MPYTKEITRKDPSCFLFVINQSASMGEQMSGGSTKSKFVADVLNQTIAETIVRCTKANGVRDYFEIGVIGYGGGDVGPAFGGALAGRTMLPISEIESNPLRIDERDLDVDGGGDVLDRQVVKIPVWIDPRHEGWCLMSTAMSSIGCDIVEWCVSHPSSYPPTIVHVTDGQSNDGSPEAIAEVIKGISTDDGEVLLFNLHVDTGSGDEILFPSSEDELPDAYGKMLFRMSSKFPPHLVSAAQAMGYDVTGDSRFFAYKAGMDFIGHFFEIGTRASQLR